MFKQGAFQIDPNATPEQIATKRALIQAMAPKYGSAKYVGEGLGQLFYGIGSGRQERRLDATESAGNASAKSLWDRIMGTANSAQSPDMGPLTVLGMKPDQPGPAIVAADPSNPEAIASDAMTALGKGATPEGIKAGLVARGMPEHVAEGFVMNFQDESGLNPGINEQNPTVPGSRGGYGLAQWTGPRRKALEAYAASKGMPVSDPGVQMDFLMTELQGPEASAWSKISGTQNAGEAGAAIVNSFLRPAESHRASREAEYLGGNGTAPGTAAAAPTSAPSIPINELYMALQNPWLSPEQKGLITSMISEQQSASDPMKQIELQKAQLELAQMQNPTEKPPEEFTTRMFTLNSLGIDPQSEEGKSYILTGKLPEPPEPGFTQLTPAEVQAAGLPPGVYQRGPDGKIDTVEKTQGIADPIADLKARATAAGLKEGTPEYQQFMLNNGKTPEGMVIESDGQGGFRMVQGAGAGSAAAKPFTEGQSKDVVYSTRAKGALEALEPIAGALTDRTDSASGWLPWGIGGGMQSEEYQVAKTAGDEFLQAILRKDTGAAITSDEQSLYGETYLPQPGDSPARLQYKSEARRRAVDAIDAGMSPAQIIAQEKALAKGGKTTINGYTIEAVE